MHFVREDGLEELARGLYEENSIENTFYRENSIENTFYREREREAFIQNSLQITHSLENAI